MSTPPVSSEDPATLESLLQACASRLAATSSSPRLDAELLLAAATGLSRGVFHSSSERLVTAAEEHRFNTLIVRRLKGVPVAYLLGTQDFWSLTLTVTPAVLVPRPETELVVERALALLAPDAPHKVLDLGTGSGAIALAIAHERPDVSVTATDISAAALAVAKGNAARLNLANVLCREGRWFDPVRGRKFRLIASNPPYVALGDPDLEPAVLAHEPEIALFAGESGLESLELIASGAPAHLEPGGWLVVEHGWQQAGAVRNLLEQSGFCHVRSHADLGGHERVTEGQHLAQAGEAGG